MIDPVKVLEHFTNFGQRGHNYGGFPVRCFARYRFDDDYKHWRSFWERSRNSEQIEKERDYKWKDDEELTRVAHAEHYVLKRMKNIFNTRRDTVRKAENYQTKDLLDKYIRRQKFNFLTLKIFCMIQLTKLLLATIQKV